jgi:hypothetical protein
MHSLCILLCQFENMLWTKDYRNVKLNHIIYTVTIRNFSTTVKGTVSTHDVIKPAKQNLYISKHLYTNREGNVS